MNKNILAPYTECQRLRYVKAGYTHFIRFKEWKESFGDYMPSSFPTTECALGSHLKSIKSRDTVQLEVYTL